MYEVLYQPPRELNRFIREDSQIVTEMSALLTDLEEFINYTISVRAYTSEGAGPYSSERVTVMTPEDGKGIKMMVNSHR